MGTATLTSNSKKLDDIDAVIKAAHERKRKLIEQSKVITYDTISQLYSLEGQQLINAVTTEHELICRLTSSGMTFEQIAELADSSKGGQQMSFSEKKNPYEN
jgi:DNA-binding NarL/FixJ family response regulator